MRSHKERRVVLCAVALVCVAGASGCSDEPDAREPEGSVMREDMSPGSSPDAGEGDRQIDLGVAGSMDMAEPDRFIDCPVAARPVYVIDAAGFELLSIDPPTLTFTSVGSVAGCPSQTPNASPFSMAVDRDANAWVLYNSGELFVYDIEEQRCEATNFNPTEEFALFGMGFVRNVPENIEEDILYIAGDGSGPGDESPSMLGRVNFVTPSYQFIGGPLEGDPELTGTANGELWGFFPGTTPAQVARIDRETAMIAERFDIPQVTGQVVAWAFAFWGGEFFIFYTGADDDSTRVLRLDPESGEVSEVLSKTGYLIVGAGVSTCAPLQNG